MTRKHIIAVLLALFMLCTMLLCGCAKEITCDFCGETKKSKEHTLEVYGENITLCDDCYKELKALAEG